MDEDCIWEDIDLVGGDIRMENSIDYKDCQNKCKKEKLCQKWTHLTNELSWKCELKTSNETVPRHRCDGCVTGFQNSNMKQCGIDGNKYLVLLLDYKISIICL